MIRDALESITTTEMVFFVILVFFVTVVAAAVGRLSRYGYCAGTTYPGPPQLFEIVVV